MVHNYFSSLEKLEKKMTQKQMFMLLHPWKMLWKPTAALISWHFSQNLVVNL